MGWKSFAPFLRVVAVASIIGGALWGVAAFRDEEERLAQNYEITHDAPTGWKQMPNKPSTLFRYKEPDTGVELRASSQQVFDETNPTPDMTAHKLASFYVDATRANMAGWEAKEVATIEVNGRSYAVIDRKAADRRIVSAFLVKGNSTFIFALAGYGDARHGVDKVMPAFRQFLGSVDLSPIPPR